MTLPDTRDIIRWTWVGPLLITLVIGLIGSWAWNLDKRIVTLENAVTELIKVRGEMLGKLETIINITQTQDIRMTQVSTRLDTLIQQHLVPQKIK